MPAEFGVGKIQKIVNPPQPQLLPEISAFSDKTQPLEVERPGSVFHNAGILVSWRVLGLDPRPSIYGLPCSGCQKTFFIYYMFCFLEVQEHGSVWESEHCR
jgi:hypothetical protein